MDLYAQWDIQKYDLNNDGMFSGEEINEDQKAAFRSLAADTGRNFSPITGLFFSGFISMVVLLFGLLFEKVLKNK